MVVYATDLDDLPIRIQENDSDRERWRPDLQMQVRQERKVGRNDASAQTSLQYPRSQSVPAARASHWNCRVRS